MIFDFTQIPTARLVSEPSDLVSGVLVYMFATAPTFDENGQLVGGLPEYVGKGIGPRPFDHVKDARRVNWGLKPKSSNAGWIYHLAKMMREDKPFAIVSLCSFRPETVDNIEACEQDAFDLEGALVKKIGRRCDGTGPLFNITEGGDGMTSERGRKLRNSPKCKAAIAKSRDDPAYRQANLEHLRRLAAKPGELERRVRRLEELNTQKRSERARRKQAEYDAMTDVQKAQLKAEREEKNREYGRIYRKKKRQAHQRAAAQEVSRKAREWLPMVPRYEKRA